MNNLICINVSQSYLCAGDENGAHITNSATMCACGGTNLFPLETIFRQRSLGMALDSMRGTQGFMLDHLPALRRMFDT